MSALDRKRRLRAPIGHRIEYHLCLACFGEIDGTLVPWVEHEELREGDDAGVPFTCRKCGQNLRPADTLGA